MLGVPIRDGSSDSQDLNRTDRHADPPRRPQRSPRRWRWSCRRSSTRSARCPRSCTRFYMYLRQAMGPFAQGPVALIARHGDECVFSADALGLRPLWQLETADDFVFSSEPGVVSVARDGLRAEAAGARARSSMVTIDRDKRALDAARRTRRCCAIVAQALAASAPAPTRSPRYDRALATGGPLEGAEVPGYSDAGPVGAGQGRRPRPRRLRLAARRRQARPADGLQRRRADRLARLRRPAGGALARAPEPRRLLQGDGRRRHQPGDRPRARDRALLDPRRVRRAGPRSTTPGDDTGTVETSFPVILGGHHDLAPLSDDDLPQDRPRAPDLPARGPLGGVPRPRRRRSTSRCSSRRRPQGAIERIKQEAVKKVRDGAELLVLTDRTVYDGERRYLDPHLATSAVDQALKQFRVEPGEENLRRRCSIVLRSAAIRNVHDVVLALGLGANGVCPYVMVEVICVDDYETDVSQPLRGAAQGDREGDLDDRHPRGARLRAPVLLDRGQARAGRDLPDRGLRRLRAGRRRLRRARRRHRRARRGSSPATRRRSRRRRSASTRRSTRRRSRPPTAPARYEEYSREGPRPRARRARSRCATSWA